MGMEEVKTGEIDAETVNRLQIVFEHVVDESDVNAMDALCYGRIPHLFDLARNTLFSAYGYVEPEDVYREHWYMPVVNFSVKLFAPAMKGETVEVQAWWHTMKGVRAWMGVEIYRKGTETLVARGFAEHCFVDDRTFKPVKPDPGWRICFRHRQIENGMIFEKFVTSEGPERIRGKDTKKEATHEHSE